MRQPETPEQWQEAVNLARLWELVHGAHLYGLVKGGPEIDPERCCEILERGREQGIVPDEAVVEGHIQALARDAAG
jgi:hypothetical protein